VTACLIVLVGFAAFAADEAGRGSREQVAKIGSKTAEEARENAHGPIREALDDANDALLAPFDGVVDSKDVWVHRGVPAVLALLAYGLGLGLLANALPRRATSHHDWREART
jgi:hypothetical protein